MRDGILKTDAKFLGSEVLLSPGHSFLIALDLRRVPIDSGFNFFSSIAIGP